MGEIIQNIAELYRGILREPPPSPSDLTLELDPKCFDPWNDPHFLPGLQDQGGEITKDRSREMRRRDEVPILREGGPVVEEDRE